MPHCAYPCSGLKLNFTATWGDPYYLGLTGVEVFDDAGEAVPLTLDMLHADPRDLHVLPGYERDDRTLDKYAELSCVALTCKSLDLSYNIQNVLLYGT